MTAKSALAWVFVGLLFVFLPACAKAAGEEPATPLTGGARKDVVNLIDETTTSLQKGQAVLRFASVKLPSLITDNVKFRKLDHELEDCRQEFYPALNAAERLKPKPQNLRELVRLYVGLRLVEERLKFVSDQLSALDNAHARPLAVQIMDTSNKVGRIAMRLHPIVYKVIDAYTAAAPDTKVQINLQWVEEDVQGPNL